MHQKTKASSTGKAALAKEKKTDNSSIPPRPKTRKALSRVEHCRAELAAVYREARAGRLDIADASKLGNILSLLSRMIESGDVERRVESLEQIVKGVDK